MKKTLILTIVLLLTVKLSGCNKINNPIKNKMNGTKQDLPSFKVPRDSTSYLGYFKKYIGKAARAFHSLGPVLLTGLVLQMQVPGMLAETVHTGRFLGGESNNTFSPVPNNSNSNSGLSGLEILGAVSGVVGAIGGPVAVILAARTCKNSTWGKFLNKNLFCWCNGDLNKEETEIPDEDPELETKNNNNSSYINLGIGIDSEVDTNTDYPKYECLKTIEVTGGKRPIVALCTLDSDHLASVDSGFQYPITVWDVTTYDYTSMGAALSYMSLCKIDSNHIASGDESSIRLWDIRTRECTILEDNDTTNSIYPRFQALCRVDIDHIASGSTAKTIKLWDINYEWCTTTLEGHNRAIWNVCMQDSFHIASRGSDVIKLWDIRIKECTATLGTDTLTQINDGSTRALCPLGPFHIASGASNAIKIWDIRTTKKCLATLKEHKYSVNTICKVNTNLFISGSDDWTIKVWDIKSMKCTDTLEGHRGKINTLCKVDTNLFASGSDDTNIKLWGIKE